jgi:hypothetical protein
VYVWRRPDVVSDRFSVSGRIRIGDVLTGDGFAGRELWRWPLWRR